MHLPAVVVGNHLVFKTTIHLLLHTLFWLFMMLIVPDLDKARYAAENKKGSIEIGKFADFTVFSQDLITVPDDKILDNSYADCHRFEAEPTLI